MKSPFPVERVYPKDLTRDEFGSFAVDFRPFWSKQVVYGGSTTYFGGKSGQSYLTEVSGCVFAENSISIHLIPRLSHGGISLTGNVKGDTITGEWVQLGYGAGAKGTFTMRRLNKPTKR